MVAGRKLQQMIFTPAPAPAMLAPASAPISIPTPILPAVAACVSIESLLPTSFAALGSVSQRTWKSRNSL
jgi:hypothetical protein